MTKKRVDVLLVERGLVESREKARALVMAGVVYSGEARVEKAGTNFAEDAPLEVRGETNPFVSRGGLKLEGALRTFGFDASGRIVADIGASTGGFTDCVLQRGAARVYAVDVGYGQPPRQVARGPAGHRARASECSAPRRPVAP
jgi:23S rRNA (cytidine1920-2'-O)/16S rRNA (cytidine1409-2'-O)-methyltransferase